MAVEEFKCFMRRKRKRGSGKIKLSVNERVEFLIPICFHDSCQYSYSPLSIPQLHGQWGNKMVVALPISFGSAVASAKLHGQWGNKMVVALPISFGSAVACGNEMVVALPISFGSAVAGANKMVVALPILFGSAVARDAPLSVVRSEEEGFLGSWHPGTVIQCGKQKRYVKYDNLLDDNNGSNHLVDVVVVPAVLDGASSTICNERGFIRPFPPMIEFGIWDLPFGLCVDVNFQEAWWEGVIFDHCDGMEERCIFFPDLGDEMKFEIGQLRITHDWNEVTEDWERRGMWIFLELVEECEQDTYVPVSIKQIWYDVRAKKDFDKIRDWTCNVKDLWKVLVFEVVNDYFTLTLKELSKGLLTEAPELESGEPAVNVHLNQEGDTANFHSILHSGKQLNRKSNVHYDDGHSNVFGSDVILAESPMEKGDMSNFLDNDQNSGSIILVQEKYDTDLAGDGASKMPIPETEVLVQKESISPVEEVFPDIAEGISRSDTDAAGEVDSSASCYEKNRRQATRIRSTYWKPLNLSGVKSCPNAINQYALASKRKTRVKLKTKVRKHLAYLGWKIEWTECGSSRRYRYISPDKQGKQVYMSLCQVCEHMKNENKADSLLSKDDQGKLNPTVDSTISHPANSPPPPSIEDVESEFCPEAVLKYYLLAFEKDPKADKKSMIQKARNHLLAAGWNCDHPVERGRGLIYKSPKNKCFGSLRVACRVYIEECLPQWIGSSMLPLDVSEINEENISQGDMNELVLRVSQLLQEEPELRNVNSFPASRSTRNCKLKRSRNLKCRLPKIQRKGLPIRLLRSSKRVQKVCAPSPSHKKPQNVLSWLIDSNVVLPRSKVHYRARGKCHPMAEGRITRDGIKCSCCQNVYSIGGFEHHANGHNNHRPAAASIFLENGKSLLDCQIQIMHDDRTRETTKKPLKGVYRAENDCICSVCHYGGDLILCDQCPSSFHMRCLGLEDIPEGDWFCPSCRCGICGLSKIEGAEDGKFLTCFQCEHKYHAKCLSRSSVYKSGKSPKRRFCGKSCEKIYEGLVKLLGQPVLVGMNNLSWTLLKGGIPEECDLGSTKYDFMVESYSKLNVALSVMHECFEPLQEVHSGRDLVEDVLFSRRSKLNRLNFQGFYTVLLEKNEELISVATVRVYGDKVAEIPLVGTRFQYRRLGMCRVLMDELEKRLMELGVERLVLPAVPSVLETWTTSFGFAKMTSSERSQFMDYTFLDFQDTVMCQKLLTKTRLDLVRSTENQPKPQDVVSASGGTLFDQSSSASEVYQAEGIDKSGMLDLQMVDTFAGKDDHLGNVAIDPVAMVNQATFNGEQLQNGTSPELSLEDGHLRHVAMSNGTYKYYKRRKTNKP
ncbi:Increased DNA methylation 1 [Senna tora]|uniref:Increased DNA methylation 1 n=1 Tax=Senna tora TaxID=362788 RepID=A0A834T6A0_9FABA|nr:Increased DNA methylation 1 [Senna tora]